VHVLLAHRMPAIPNYIHVMRRCRQLHLVGKNMFDLLVLSVVSRRVWCVFTSEPIAFAARQLSICNLRLDCEMHKLGLKLSIAWRSKSLIARLHVKFDSCTD
jgi:hypothetical protein